jgi:chaperonin GroEL (HSP60 family)
MREATECIIYQLNYEDNLIPYLAFKNIYRVSASYMVKGDYRVNASYMEKGDYNSNNLVEEKAKTTAHSQIHRFLCGGWTC